MPVIPARAEALRERLGSLSLRLTLYLVAVLMGSTLAMGVLFDGERAKLLEKRELRQLQHHTERIVQEVDRIIGRLRDDLLFLVDTPPVQGLRRAVESGGADPIDRSTVTQWLERLQQIFLTFAVARPGYVQIRLIGVRDEGLELVRVDWTKEGLRPIPREELQHKGDREYFRETSVLPAGSVYLSRVDLNQERGQISLPHQPTLRVATPVRAPDGDLFGMLVVNLDMAWVFERLGSSLPEPMRLYVIDESGEFVVYPEPGWAHSAQLGQPFGLAGAFPGQAERILGMPPGSGEVLDLREGEVQSIGYLIALALDPGGGERRLIFLLAEPRAWVYQAIGVMRRWNLVAMGGLLSLAVFAVVFMVRRQTRSLSLLAHAANGIGRGNYRVPLPAASSAETEALVAAFGRMAVEVEKREEALTELNLELEQRVDARTKDLAREHGLAQLILESIGEGVVVADREGRFLLWNNEAAQIVGLGPGEVPPEHWPAHFGVFPDEEGNLMPHDELPLVRAIRGEPTDGVELYLRNAACAEGRWVRVTGRPLRDAESKVKGGVIVFRDLTEQKQLQRHLEQQRAKNARIGRLALTNEIVRSVVHELSQPIAAVSTYAAAAARLGREERISPVELANILGNIERLSGRSGEILEMLRSQIHCSRGPLVAIDVIQMADLCLKLVQDRIARQGVRVERRYGSGVPTLHGDAEEIKEILMQLVTNALDAMEETPREGRCLEVSACFDPDIASVIVEVADTGRGVSTEFAEALFEPWVTDKPDAPGIGLTIVHSLVKARNGRIEMRARDTGGTLFRVVLPVHQELAS